MKYWLIWLLTWAFVHNSKSQEMSFSGNINSSNKEKYTMILKSCLDSSLVKVELSSEDGSFRFDNIPQGNYFMDIRLFNQSIHLTQCFNLKDKGFQLPTINLNQSLQLKEVRVVQQKELVEQKAGKIIFNVEHSLESPGSDALSVMQKAPGISVDGNGSIAMRGKKGVIVMINGKPTYVSGAQLTNLLRTTTASQISKIEVISNPSAKYDAEGNAGIVNIIMKKDLKRGTNGLVILSGGSGRFYKSSAGANINVKGNKLNFFASMNFFANENYNDLKLYRQFYKKGVYQGAYRQNNMLWFPAFTEMGKVNLDYQLSKKTVFGISSNGSLSQLNTPGLNFCVVEDNQGVDQSTYTSGQKSKDRYGNASFNVNSRTQLDSNGAELSTDFDYAYYGSSNNQHFKTVYADMFGNPTQNDYRLLGISKGDLNIYSGKADLNFSRWNVKWELGGKSSYVKADNNIQFFNESGDTPLFDSNQSNHFIYSENINALYGIGSFEKNNFSVQLGLRTEQTVAKGKQLLNGESFDRNYWQLFPNVSVSRKINEKHDLAFSFSRRIQRPGYDLMNPTRLFIDATTYKVGNPFLMPQNSYLFELNHTFKQKYLTKFSYMFVNKSITEVLIPDEQNSNITIQTNKNINKQWVYTLSGSVPVKPTSWWTINSDVSIYHSYYSGQLSNNTIASGIVSFNAKTLHSFILPKSFTIQVDGFYQYGEWYSFTTIQPFGQCNIAAQKTLKNKRTTIKLAANDIFFTSKFRGSSKYNDYEEHYFVRRDSRTVIVSITHKYGKNGVPGIRSRGTGADDEKQRAGKHV